MIIRDPNFRLAVSSRPLCEPIWAGVALLTSGFGWFILFDNQLSILELGAIEAVAGFGVGMNFQSLLIALQAHVVPDDFATAAATFGFTRNITTLAVVIGKAVFQHRMQTHAKTLTSVLGDKRAAHFDGSSGSQRRPDRIISRPSAQGSPRRVCR